jgi:mannan endo-1,4-beta-mannosidase
MRWIEKLFVNLFFNLGWLSEWLSYYIFPKHPPSNVFYVDGRYLYDNGGRKIVLRGVNLPLLDDWGFPGSDKLAEIDKTGANAIRIQWYVAYPSRPLYGVGDLDLFLEKCRSKAIIPILMLADFTSQSTIERLNDTLVPWWTRADVVAVLKRHQRYLIINLANELGAYRWAGDDAASRAAALTAFKEAYKTAITSIRAADLRMPIMIDAPDGGTTIDVFTSIGQELVNHDPRHSLLLSVHAYWAGYNGTSVIDPAFGAKLPIVFGEIANKQDETIAGVQHFGYYDLDGTNVSGHPTSTNFRYQQLLVQLTQLEIGWLAWAWWPDSCATRRITPDGNYTGAINGGPTGLTAYGEDIVNNATYGIRRGYFATQRTPSLPGPPPA